MTTPERLPDPPIAGDVDLRDFPYMPLDVARLRDSALAISASGEEFRAAVLLWCASWHQIPAGSLPDDDRALATYVGLGRGAAGVKEWKSLKAGALHGWQKCSDGRLYHPVVAQKAAEAQSSRTEYREGRATEQDRLKRFREEKKSLRDQLGALGIPTAWDTPIEQLRTILRDATRNAGAPNSNALETLQPATPETLPATDPQRSNPVAGNAPETRLSEVKGREGKGREKEEEEKICAAPKNDATRQGTESPPFLTIPLVGKDQPEHTVTEADVTEYAALYPAVDVRQALRDCRGWNLANPSRRKTPSGIQRHIHTWLARRQNGGGAGQGGPPPQGSPGAQERLEAGNREAVATWLGAHS